MMNKLELRWKDYIHHALNCLRNRKNSAIEQIPAQLLLGYTPPRPGAWVLLIYQGIEPTPRDERMATAREKQAEFRRKHYPEPREAPITYEVGQPVIVKNFTRNPFDPTWVEPYRITKQEGETVYAYT